jgi:hypothetical protein
LIKKNERAVEKHDIMKKKEEVSNTQLSQNQKELPTMKKSHFLELSGLAAILIGMLMAYGAMVAANGSYAFSYLGLPATVLGCVFIIAGGIAFFGGLKWGTIIDRGKILSLLLQCPAGEELDACPLKATRSLLLEEQSIYTENLNDKDVAEIKQKHNTCFSSRKKLNTHCKQ